jgi:hypothetical protein
VAKFFTYLIGKRGIVLAGAVLGAALSAKGFGVHTNGFFDGPR